MVASFLSIIPPHHRLSLCSNQFLRTLDPSLAMMPAATQQHTLALLFMLKELISLYPLVSEEYTKEVALILRPLTLWPEPFGGLATELRRYLFVECVAPGESLLRYVYTCLITPGVSISWALKFFMMCKNWVSQCLF